MHTPKFDARKKGNTVGWGSPHRSETANGKNRTKLVEKRKTVVEKKYRSLVFCFEILSFSYGVARICG